MSVTGLPAHIRAVFFDVVGTILFPSPPAPNVYADVARQWGCNLAPAEIRTRFIEAYNAQESIDRSLGWITSEEREENRWRHIVAATVREVPDPEACFRHLYEHFGKPTSWKLSDEIEGVIAALVQRGIVVGLGSNYDRRLWSVVDGFPALVPLRERTIISSVVGFRKPAPEFFRHVVEAGDCEPGEVLFVGDDMENDYLGALAAGLDARLFDAASRSDIPKRIARLMDVIT